MKVVSESLVQELRRNASHGASVPDLLRLLHERLGPEAAYSTTLAKYFMAAFDLPLRTVSPVGGWAPDSTGEISDVRIQELIYPEMMQKRQLWMGLIEKEAGAAASADKTATLAGENQLRADLTGYDPSMELAWQAAEWLSQCAPGSVSALPAFLQADTLRKANAKRAVFLMEVENAIEAEIAPIRERQIAPLVRGSKVTTVPEYQKVLASHVPTLADRFAHNLVIAQITARLLSDLSDPVMRVNVSLRLFAGYLDAAKIIADAVRDRRNDAKTRRDTMPSVDARAKNDTIYGAGVRAAPFYKRAVLKQDIFKDGIPAGSIVLEDWIDW